MRTSCIFPGWLNVTGIRSWRPSNQNAVTVDEMGWDGNVVIMKSRTAGGETVGPVGGPAEQLAVGNEV
jgi:hypothetical protein